MSKYIDTLLRRTLLEMMERRPLDDITVVELCNRAEVNRKTFYNHFADISALVGSVVLRELDELAGEVSFPGWNDTIRRFALWLKDSEPFVKAVWVSASRPAFERALQERLSEKTALAVDDAITWLGEYHGEEYAVTRYQRRVLTRYYASLIASVLISWIEGGMREPAEDVVRLIGTLNADGLYDGIRQFTLENAHRSE